IERGVGHAKGIEQPLSLELKQRLPRYHLDDAPEHVGRMAVVPQRSRLFSQWQFCQTLGELGVVEIAFEQTGVHIEFSYPTVAVESVSETRGVAQQVFDGDRAIEGFEHQRRLSVLIAPLDADFYIGEGRNVF